MEMTPIFANAIMDLIHKGGPIMYPILVTALVAICILAERITWWLRLAGRRSPRRLEAVYEAIESGKIKEAIQMSRNATDPIIRMIHHGLNHQHSSLQGALEVAAGLEMQKAGRFLNAMDTIVTLGPLLGLLGTVTGIMGSFMSIGDTELAVEKVTGGIGEALIATAAGLGIAIATLIPLNYFHSRLAKFQFDLEAAATNVTLLVAQKEAEQKALDYQA